MKKYRYEIELMVDTPEYMQIPKRGAVSAEKEWFGHSYGEAVGRIYSDGTVESFFKHDMAANSKEWFEELRSKGILRSTYRHLVDVDTLQSRGCEEFYLMHRIVGHSSEKPTVADQRIDSFWNVRYEYTYELLLVVDEEYKRYITNTIKTEGKHLYCLIDEIQSLEDIFEEWAEKGEQGFRFDREADVIAVEFYNDFGQETEVEFVNTDEILECISSIRIIDLKSERIKTGEKE